MGLIFERLSTYPPTHPPTRKLADTGRSYYLEKSGIVYLILESPNLPTAEEKIRGDIQIRRNNIIKKRN